MLRFPRVNAAAHSRRYGAFALDVIAPLLIIIAVSAYGWHLYSAGPSPSNHSSDIFQMPKEPVSIASVPTEGARTATVVLIAYSDFQCPFCRRFAVETLPQLRSSYVSPGRLLLAFRHLPLKIHDHAIEAAMVAVCASAQNRFWEMHDLLFRSNVSAGGFAHTAANKLNLPGNAFDECLSGRTGDAQRVVARDVVSAHSLGITSTPTFVIGRLIAPGDRVQVSSIISGARPWTEFAEPIDALLK